MGINLTIPVQYIQSPIVSFNHASLYTIAGKRRENAEIENVGQNGFEHMTESLFDEAMKKRLGLLAAKNKLKYFDNKMILDKYPHFNKDHILDYKAEFQRFDLNQDGLIDFEEMCQVMNELGDQSDEQTRRNYFNELDEDKSGAVDFEEYLALIDNLMSGNSSNFQGLGDTSHTGAQKDTKIRRMSIMQQIDTGVF